MNVGYMVVSCSMVIAGGAALWRSRHPLDPPRAKRPAPRWLMVSTGVVLISQASPKFFTRSLRDRHRPAAKLPGRAGHIAASREPARIWPLTVCAARGLRLVAAMPLTGWWSMDSRFHQPRHQSGDQVLEPEECGRQAFGYASPGRSGRETPSSSSWGGVFQRRPDNKGGAVTWAIATIHMGRRRSVSPSRLRRG